MKKKGNEKLLDVLTGVVVGAFVGLHYPLGEYNMILLIAVVVLGGRFVLALK